MTLKYKSYRWKAELAYVSRYVRSGLVDMAIVFCTCTGFIPWGNSDNLKYYGRRRKSFLEAYLIRGIYVSMQRLLFGEKLSLFDFFTCKPMRGLN